VTIPRTIAHDGEGPEATLQLLVIEGDAVTVHDLPSSGSLVVGRDEKVDIQLVEPSASAHHARLYVEDLRVAIEDLGSTNGTQVRGERIPGGRRIELAAGEAALLGSAVLVVQRGRRRLAKRRLWPHGYFEMRLAEECDLAQGRASTFSVARIDHDPGVSAETFVEAAAEVLRPSSIVAAYGPRAFEILLRGTTAEAAERALEALLDHPALYRSRPRLALAHFPADGQNVAALIARACARLRPPAPKAVQQGIVVTDDRMRRLYEMGEKTAGGTINVLIQGETGVGKEIVAESIHRASRRAKGPFLPLNCAALTENLLESELFGHERGAFTSATTSKPGLLETASGGTVFLDEIGEMSPALQAKLLRVIETKLVTRVGGLRATPIDVRFVSATHRDLVQEIREKRFRSDLYYRLNGVRLEIPPLRERPSEIRALCEEFLARLARQSELPRAPRLGDEATALLESYGWPGNVRELRNVMERAFLLSDGGDIGLDHLPLETLRPPADPEPLAVAELATPADDGENWSAKELAERARLLEALRLEGGNQTRAAERLKCSRGTVLRQLEKYKIARPQKRDT
jgi:DNA-binding NtrC family response regulator